jgi:hypothetical protein
MDVKPKLKDFETIGIEERRSNNLYWDVELVCLCSLFLFHQSMNGSSSRGMPLSLGYSQELGSRPEEIYADAFRFQCGSSDLLSALQQRKDNILRSAS